MQLRTVIGLYVLAAIAVAAIPLFANSLVLNLVLRASSIVILAISWNLAANAGLISLGHSAFWGIGSYAALLAANRFGWPFSLSLLPAVLAGAGVAVLLALITGRLRGIFFAISTLALSEGLRVVAVMTPDLTGGGAGVFIEQHLRPSASFLTTVAGVGSVLCAFLAHLLSRTPFHYACRALRNNEQASQMLGINPMRFRILVLAISGAMASFAGAANIWYTGFLDPTIGFDLHVTILAQIGPILGGIHTLAGPILGAVATLVIAEATRLLLGEQGFSLLVYGAILVGSVLLMPNGIVGALRRRPRVRPDGLRVDPPAKAA